MPMTNAGAQRCLQSGLISAAMYAGLHTGTPPASGNEFSASGYDALTLPSASWTVANEMAMLNMTVEWDDAAPAEWGDPTTMSFWSHRTQRATANLLAHMGLSQDVDNIVLGTRVFAQSGDLVFRIPLVGITAAGAALCFDGGLISNTIYLGLHTGATPTAANELSGTGYAALEVVTGEWTVADNAASLNADQEWAGAAGANWGDPARVGFWNHLTNRAASNLLGHMMLAQDVAEIMTGGRVYAESGDVTITIPLS